MAEISLFKWPDETGRFIDDEFDKTPVIERQKIIWGDEALLLMGVYKTGRFKYAKLNLGKTNGFKLEYTFTNSFAGISGSHLTTDLGTVLYDKDGYICRVILQPVERLEKRFWRECVSESDKKAVDNEEIARMETLKDLQQEYIEKEKIKAPVLARHNRHWKVEPFIPIHGLDATPMPWGQWVIYNKEAILVELLDDNGSKNFNLNKKQWLKIV